MTARSQLLLSVLSLGSVACEAPDAITHTDAAAKPRTEIVDAVHNQGNSHFYFLPPLVPAPSPKGEPDVNLTPLVTICAGSTECEFIVTEFAASADPDQQYHANWKTDECYGSPCTLDPALFYRLRVTVGPVELGHADLQVFANTGQVRNRLTNEYINLIEGRMLPVRFRVETGIVSAVSITPSPATVPIGQRAQLTATVFDLHGNPIPAAPVSWAVDDPRLAAVTGGGQLEGRSGGCTSVTAASEGVQARASLTVTPTPVDIAYLQSDGIYTVAADGCNPKLLFRGNVLSRELKWSRDGSKLAFLVNALPSGGDQRIHTIRADGTDLRILPTTAIVEQGGTVGDVDWSPDGTMLVFNARIGGEPAPSEIYTINADGTGERRLTFPTDHSADARSFLNPQWSPLGRTITFTSAGDHGPGPFYSIAVDGSGSLTELATGVGNYQWSPDGSRIAYQTGGYVFSLRSDGTDVRQLSLSLQGDGVSWSRDGTRIAFISPALETINADGTNRRVLSSGAVQEHIPPGWSRDNGALFFARVAGGQWTVYRINVDGTQMRALAFGVDVKVRP